MPLSKFEEIGNHLPVIFAKVLDTTKSRQFIVPLSKFEEIGNHLPVVFAKVLDFLTSVYSIFLEKFRIRGRGKSEWILDAFNKVFIWDFNLAFYLPHDN